jgi:hypothetical protein
LSPILGNEIVFLQAKVDGEIKSRNQTVGQLNLKNEFAILGGDIVRNEFFVNIQTSEQSEPEFIQACVSSGAHFVVKDYFYFPGKEIPSVESLVYNCNQGKEFRKESLLKGYIYKALTDHYKKTFSFLPRRTQTSPSPEPEEGWNVRFFLDASSINSLEKDKILSYLSGQGRNSKLKTELHYVSNGNYFWTLPDQAKSELRFGKSNSTDQLVQGLNKVIQSIPRTETKSVLYVLLNPLQFQNSNSWSRIFNQARAQGVQVILLIPGFASANVINALENLSRSSGAAFFHIKIRQSIGLKTGEQRYLALWKGAFYSMSEDPFSDSAVFNQNTRYLTPEIPNPFEMGAQYQSVSGNFILDSGNLQSNLDKLFLQIHESVLNIEPKSHKKELVQSYGEAFSLRLTNRQRLEKGRKYILETEFVKDSSNSYGARNLAEKTVLHSPQITYPKLLVFRPSEISEYMRRYNLDRLRCFMEIQVADSE